MRLFVALFLTSFAVFSHAADWVQVSQISNNVREVDRESIKGDKPVLAFNSRHVVADAGEYRVGRNTVKYLVMEQRIDCSKRTILALSSEAQRDDGSSISKQILSAPEYNPILPGSVDDDILKFVCG